jgi:hypothetical protein
MDGRFGLVFGKWKIGSKNVTISWNIHITLTLKVLHCPLLLLLVPHHRPTMRCPHTEPNYVALSAPSAFAITDGLLRMAHCLIVELPENELREIRYTINTLLSKTDLLLDTIERDLSLNFDGLDINPGEFQMGCLGSSDVFQMFKTPLGVKILVQCWLPPQPLLQPTSVKGRSLPRLAAARTFISAGSPLPLWFQFLQ